MVDVSAKELFAICILRENQSSGVNGVVRFHQKGNGKCHIRAIVKGLKEGKHGIHIHEFGNLLEGCVTAGEHYNPFSKTHGDRDDKDRHLGDLGNIDSNEKTDAILDYEDSLIQLHGETSVIGRTVVVHANPDDLGRGNFEDSKSTGHSGPRLSCGVIGISSPFEMKASKL